MKIETFKFALIRVLLLGVLAFSGCEDDDDASPDNEQELITTVELTFTPAAGSAVVAKAVDRDGDGGNAPVIDNVSLAANTNYTLSIRFLDESKTPAEDITAEVKEESAEHLVCLVVTGAMPSPTITDKDSNNRNLGLTSTLRTSAAGAGSLRVTLKHEPNKTAADPCATGETDAEVQFAVTVRP